MLEWDEVNIHAHREISIEINLKLTYFAGRIFSEISGCLRSQIIVVINTVLAKHKSLEIYSLFTENPLTICEIKKLLLKCILRISLVSLKGLQ